MMGRASASHGRTAVRPYEQGEPEGMTGRASASHGRTAVRHYGQGEAKA